MEMAYKDILEWRKFGYIFPIFLKVLATCCLLCLRHMLPIEIGSDFINSSCLFNNVIEEKNTLALVKVFLFFLTC